MHVYPLMVVLIFIGVTIGSKDEVLPALRKFFSTRELPDLAHAS